MLVRDVVNQLRLVLPEYTDLFSDVVIVNSIVVTEGVITVETFNPHGLKSGDKVTLTQVQTRTPILSIDQNGVMFLVESEEHDITLDKYNDKYVEFGGFTNPDWNDSFLLQGVLNREKIIIKSNSIILPLPVLTGSEHVLETRIDGVRGDYEIVVLDNTHFTVPGSFSDGVYTCSSIAANVRIAGSRSIDRFISHYTKQISEDRLWGVVVPHARDISKDRSTYSDAIASLPAGTDMRLRLIDGFTFYVVVKISNEIAAVEAIDTCRELTFPILKSLFGVVFESGLSAKAELSTIPTTDAEAEISRVNNAFYIHAFEFEVQVDITTEDSAEPRNTRAFRDILYKHDLDQQEATVRIDLDQEIIKN